MVETIAKEFSAFEKKYNDCSYLSILNINNQKGKIALGNSDFDTITVEHSNGAMSISDVVMKKTAIVLNSVNLEVTNLYGETAKISLTKSYLSYYNDETTALVLHIPVYAGGSQLEVGNNIKVEGK